MQEERLKGESTLTSGTLTTLERLMRITGDDFEFGNLSKRDLNAVIESSSAFRSLIERVKKLKDLGLLSNELFSYIVSGEELRNEKD